MFKSARTWIHDHQDNIALGAIVAGSAVSSIITVMFAMQNDRLKKERDEARRVADFMINANLDGYMATVDDEGIVKFVDMDPQE